MKPKLVSISEEIVRWSFEISVNRSDDWLIAFTNPTAGPWKRITAPDSDGKRGEIHRFEICDLDSSPDDQSNPNEYSYFDLDPQKMLFDIFCNLRVRLSNN